MYYYRQNAGTFDEAYVSCSSPITAPNVVELTEEEYNEAIAALDAMGEQTDDEATAEDYENALRDIGVTL